MLILVVIIFWANYTSQTRCLDPLYSVITTSTRDYSMGILQCSFTSLSNWSLFSFKHLVTLGISNVDGILSLGDELPRIVYFYWSSTMQALMYSFYVYLLLQQFYHIPVFLIEYLSGPGN